MKEPGETVVTIETPAGRGAVAVVSVTGPNAACAVDACFLAANNRRLHDQPPGAIRFGRWREAAGEEVVVCRSENEPPRVEVHCHGGTAAVSAVVADLAKQGCATRDWQEAVLESNDSLVTCEAKAALRRATTEKTAAILLDQAQGALASTLQDILEAPDGPRATERLDRLLQWSALGVHLTRPWSVVLSGPPNVGKSSLINAMLGYGRSIVLDQPGTTRDVVTAATAIDGWPVSLADTAGLRDTEDEVERTGVEFARQALDSADLVIEVQSDANQGGNRTGVPDARRIDAWNKCDLAPPPAGFSGVATSAVAGQGIEELLRAVTGKLVPAVPAPGEGVPVSTHQVERLQIARSALAAGQASQAREALVDMLRPANLSPKSRGQV